MALPALVGGVVRQLESLAPVAALIVPMALLALLFMLLFDIRSNTRRTAEAVERLAERCERTDDPDR